ncbi:hypothetical protein ACFE04_027816 [Oxalis oulophora]
MNSLSLFGSRVLHKSSSCFFVFSQRRFCELSFDDGSSSNIPTDVDNEYFCIDEPLKKMYIPPDFDCNNNTYSSFEKQSSRQCFIRTAKSDAGRVLEILHQDGPGFDAKVTLSELGIRVSGILVREVLLGILRNVTEANKTRCAKLAYKFFLWSSLQENYRHTTSIYHLIMEIFVDCEEYKAMWKLVDEMIENKVSITARTFNILICSCGEAGLAKKAVERFIKLKTFSYRPFKHSYNAILHSLLALNQYKLIEWVHQQMQADGYYPDTLTYNVLMYAKYRLGKLDEFSRLLSEMNANGFAYDLHTYNILLHVLGKGDKPLEVRKLLEHMREVGIDPSVLHFTTLIDGLSRAGNLEACKYFFDDMRKNGLIPDVVCYTVMITGYIVAGQLEKAEEMFDEMINIGQLPNVLTYNSMIRGYCMAGKFDKAWALLNEMESRGCKPNFLVYCTLFHNLKRADKLKEAHEVIKHMNNKGQYTHLVPKIWRYRRC